MPSPGWDIPCTGTTADELPTAFWSKPWPAVLLHAKESVELRSSDFWATPFAYFPNADNELHHNSEKQSGPRLSKHAQYDWKEPDDGMKTDKRSYASGRLHTVSSKPVMRTKEFIGMDSEKENHPNGSFQYNWYNLRDTIKVKNDVNVRKEIDPTENILHIRAKCFGEGTFFLLKSHLGLNRKNHESRKSNRQKKKK